MKQCYKCLAYIPHRVNGEHICSDVLIHLVSEARKAGRLRGIDSRFKKKSHKEA